MLKASCAIHDVKMRKICLGITSTMYQQTYQILISKETGWFMYIYFLHKKKKADIKIQKKGFFRQRTYEQAIKEVNNAIATIKLSNDN